MIFSMSKLGSSSRKAKKRISSTAPTSSLSVRPLTGSLLIKKPPGGANAD